MKPGVTKMGGGAVRVTLDCEDYNGLWDKMAVGAPDGTQFVTQADGTDIAIDPNAVAGSIVSMLDAYWRAPIALVPDPITGPDIDDTYILAPIPPGVPVLQWYTDLTMLRAALDDMAAHVSGAVRYWIDPDLRPHWRELLPSQIEVGNGATGTFTELAEQAYMMLWPSPDPSQIVDAPFSIGPIFDGAQIMAEESSIDWDYSHVAYRAYVRGSTVPGSGFNEPLQIDAYFGSGDQYIDAPGSIYKDDKNAILAWYAAKNLKPFIVGSARTSPGYDGWRVGQTLLVTDADLALFSSGGDIVIENRPFTIQGVTGTLKGAGQPIGVRIGVIDATTMVSVQSFNWNETLGEAGRASVVLELLNQPQGMTLPTPMPFSIPPACDIELYIPDGTSPVIEYELDFGDIPPGALSRQLAKIPDPPAPAVVYKFKVSVDDPNMPDGASSRVTAQLTDGAGAEVKLAGVPMEWVAPIFQFEDNAETTPGTVYTLADDVGTTDAAGCVFSTVNRSGAKTAEYHWHVEAVALPIE